VRLGLPRRHLHPGLPAATRGVDQRRDADPEEDRRRRAERRRALRDRPVRRRGGEQGLTRTQTGDAELLDAIRAEIRAVGPIPFSRFQALALTHPTRGYYTRGAAIGRDGADFWTAPEISPAFGEMIGVQIAEMAERLGNPPDFRVVEIGGGTGALADSLLASWERQGSPLRRPGIWRMAEISPALRARQELTLARHAGVVVRDTTETPAPSSAPGVVLMNEVLDALPVDRLRRTEHGFEEIRVGLDGERLIEVAAAARPESLRALACDPDARMEALAAGHEIEVRPGLGGFIARATAAIGPGYLLVIDYAHAAAEFRRPERRRGTVMAYHRHRAAEDLLDRVGHQDLTAHVDLDALARAAATCGFTEIGRTTQMKFLLALGLGSRIEALAAGDETPHRIAERLSLTALVRPGGMGEIFKVWIGARRAPGNLGGLVDPLRRG
jgi:SAM-dependent MidA family methyltransferase